MAKKATGKAKAKDSGKSSRKTGTALARRSGGGGSGGSRSQDMGDAFIKLLQSPLVAELVAVAATAALASLAEHGFTSSSDGKGKRAGKAVKAAGKAAASAIGRRLGTEIDEIRKAAKGGAKG